MALLSAGSAILASAILESVQMDQWLRLIVALFPVPFFIAFIWAELVWIRSLDEFHRRVTLESLAIAFPLAIVLGVVIEALQKAGVFTGLTIGSIWPWMALTWVPGLWIARRRYR
jgi:hypothetical protein